MVVEPGATVCVLATDPASMADFTNFCAATGHKLLKSDHEAPVYVFVVEKASAPSPTKSEIGEARLVKLVFVLFDSLNRLALGPYGGTRLATPNFDAAGAARADLRRPLCRQPALHAGAARHADRAPQLPAPQLGPARAVRQLVPRAARTRPASTATSSPTITTTGRTAARPITAATTPTSSSAARSATPGRRWSSRTGSGCASSTTSASTAKSAAASTPHIINREFIREEKDFPSVQCFAAGLEFLERNRDADNWLLQIETFDPHEPFYAPARFREQFRPAGTARSATGRATAGSTSCPRNARSCAPTTTPWSRSATTCWASCSTISTAHDLWKDTALVLTTDHGFLLGEHDFWAKNRMSLYEEIGHIPLFIYHRARRRRRQRRSALTQTIDLAPTFLDLFGAERAGRDAGPFAAAAARGGRRGPRRRRCSAISAVRSTSSTAATPISAIPPDLERQEVYQYTLMPTPSESFFTPEELAGAELAGRSPSPRGRRCSRCR